MAIKVEEIRIGNIVSYEATAHVVTGIDDRGLITSYWHKGNNPAEVCFDNAYMHDGFPLTEDWLVANGKSVEKPQHETANYDFIVWFSLIKVVGHKAKGIRVFVCMGGVCTEMEHIKYIHQLQNLTYALTGQELTS